ncbi:hypothetical protein HF086_006128 [Spodoptera exigua]|uniref:Uncharacterized protein n=1 Tax=Spodoptera exigua TaxID=7107 RepID=A0A922SMA9_SPOEX|nr:hypothetical protein HF086_006128 [Spodoptera exigua]
MNLFFHSIKKQQQCRRRITSMPHDCKGVTSECQRSKREVRGFGSGAQRADAEGSSGGTGTRCRINGFDSTISSTHKQALAAVTGVEEVRNLLHQLDAKANETIANVTANTKRDEEIRTDLGNLNSTLTSQVEALQTRIQEITSFHAVSGRLLIVFLSISSFVIQTFPYVINARMQVYPEHLATLNFNGTGFALNKG